MPLSHFLTPRMDPALLHDAAKKRRKGATRLSCAECRRLKLRCDRNVPCGSCVKRGCGAICPDGSLTTGQGNRFVLASTGELHEKISQLSIRVRQLEDALRESHASVSNERHSLLAEDLLQIKAPLQREPPGLRNIPRTDVKQEDQNEVVNAFGSLSINAAGGVKYYGSIANSWLFLQNEVNETQENDASRLNALKTILSPAILAWSEIYYHLPQAQRAEELCQAYYRLGAWMYNPISEQDFYEEIYSVFYAPDLPDDPLISHKLSLMFMVLAIGSLMDLQTPAYNIEATKYYHLARAALCQSSLLDDPTISAVQSLFLMTFYLFFSDRHGSSSGARWVIMGIAIKIAQSIGLHRDLSKWDVDSRETLRRRQLFWELFTYDSWQCWTFGRPPSFNMAHIDCKMPYNTDGDRDSFHAWKHRFTSECMSVVLDQAFGAKTPSYSTVLHLDRKLRAFPVPANLQIAGFGSATSPSESHHQDNVMLVLQRHIVLAIREMNLLYLHRSFFARALTDHPKDPLGSPYGTSVIAAYRSAGLLVALMHNLHSQLKEPSERIWFLWTHMFSCAIISGSIVTRCPSMSLAPSALSQLDSACKLFAKAARGFCAQPVLDVMTTLQKKAHHSLEEYCKGKSLPLTRQLPGHSAPCLPVEENDELAVLGGKTRLVARKESISPPTSPPAVIDRSPTSMHPVVPLPLAPPGNQVHPYVVEYLRTFPQTSGLQDGNGQVTGETVTGAYNVGSPVREQAVQHHLQPVYDGGEDHYGECQTPVQSMELVPGQFPSYFPVYEYGFVGNGMNGYDQVQNVHSQARGMQGGLRESPEANEIPETWQNFVKSSGLGLRN